jgi:MFS transporter, PPP family, 3-phenylpropionic acid transporter
MSSAATDRSFAVRMALFYGALFVIYGMHTPYMPVWLDWRGLSASEISAVMAAPFFLRLLITPVVALAADRNGNHRRILIALAWISAGIALALSEAATFWPILALAVPLVICNSTIMPLTETVAMSGVRRFGADYGRMRLWGSLTFIAASFAGGVAVAQYGGGAGIWLVVLGCVVTVVAAHLLPDPPHDVAQKIHAPFWSATEPAMLLKKPAFVAFLAVAGLIQAAHATFLTFGTLIWQSQGLSGGWIGALWAIGVFAEVVLFAVSGWLVSRFGPVRLLIMGAAASILRWAAMAIDPSLPLLVPLQVLHGVTYGAAHIGAIHFINQAVPRQAAGSAQALYATVAAGLAMGIATLAAGAIYASYGSLSYLAMAGIAIAALVAGYRLQGMWTGGMLFSEPGGIVDATEISPIVPVPEAP